MRILIQKTVPDLFYGGQGTVEINYNNVLPIDILQLNEEKVKGSKLVSPRNNYKAQRKLLHDIKYLRTN